MPLIRIDSREIEVDEGTTVMQAADRLGIFIPRYCYHPGLSIAGCCRICAVELEDSPKLVTACSTYAAEGMVVQTDTERVKTAQRSVMEFLLLNHPLDCPVCDQAGECELQDYSYEYGFAESRFREQKIKQRKKDVGRDLLLYADRCILCTRCVRFAQEVSGYEQVGIFDRGSQSEIDVFPGIRIDDLLAGNIADICPVGAFLSKDFLFKRRVWELTSTKSICPACSAGCNVLLDHADGHIQRLRPRHNPGVNGCWMCDIGRMDYKLVERSDRLKNTAVRTDDMVCEVPWDEALAQATNQLKELMGRYGVDSVGFVISSDATNEEAFALAKLATETGAAQNLRLLAGERAERVEFAGGFVIESDRSPNEHGVFDILSRFLPSAAVEAVTDMRSLAGKRGLYVLCGTHSDAEHIGTLAREARKAKLVVVQATLPSALTEAATIVFPGATYAEKDGTLTNSRGLVQLIRPAFAPPGEARADLGILLELCDAMGIVPGFRTAREAAAEIARELRGYPSHEQIGETGWQMASSGASLPAKGGEL
jgi:NADH-quinone oxidoreductase subunit G